MDSSWWPASNRSRDRASLTHLLSTDPRLRTRSDRTSRTTPRTPRQSGLNRCGRTLGFVEPSPSVSRCALGHAIQTLRYAAFDADYGSDAHLTEVLPGSARVSRPKQSRFQGSVLLCPFLL